MDYAMLGALTLLCVQIAEGTDPLFSFMAFITIIAWVISYNILGGINYLSGMFVFGQGALGFVVPMVVKACFREAADTHLTGPLKLVSVYMVGHLTILFVSYLIVRIRPRKPLLSGKVDIFRSSEMATGMTAMAFLVVIVLHTLGDGSSGSGWASLLTQLSTHLLPFAMALNLTSEIQWSNGRKTLNYQFLLIAFFLVYNGLTHSVKESIYEPLAVYVVCCAAMKVRFSFVKIMVLGGITAFSFLFIYPLVQSYHGSPEAYAGLSPTELAEKFVNASTYIQSYKNEQHEEVELASVTQYFGRDAGFFQRYSLIALDAALIDSVKNGDYMGYNAIYLGFINWIPHFLYPNKPEAFNSQTYMHRLPGSNEEDTTTGISFGSFGTAFALGGWPGLVILVFFINGGYMLVLDAVAPPVHETPWMVCMLAYLLHVGPEANIDFIASYIWYTPLELAFAVFLTRYGVRGLSGFVSGAQRSKRLREFAMARQQQLQPQPAQFEQAQ